MSDVVPNEVMDKRQEEETKVWEIIGGLEPLLEKDRRLADLDTPSPDFFICGAAKAGTTSLFNYLGQHPQVFTPSQKEPGYFSALRPMKSPVEYSRLFEKTSSDQIAGEASGAYLTSPDSAARIAQVAPEAKIIIMLRNPADRAFSLYQWMVGEGYEWASTFRQALRLEAKRRENLEFIQGSPEYYYNFLYCTTGYYVRYIERFLSHFDRSQLRFLTFDEFVNDPVASTREVFRFLGCRDDIGFETPVRNPGTGVFSVRLQFWLRQSAWPYLKQVPFGLRLARKAMLWNTAVNKPDMDDSFRKRLLQGYEEDIRRTGSLIGRDLASRWPQP